MPLATNNQRRIAECGENDMTNHVTYKSVAAPSAVWARIAVYLNGKRVGLIRGDSFGFRYEPTEILTRQFIPLAVVNGFNQE